MIDPVAAINERLREVEDEIAPLEAERDRLVAALELLRGEAPQKPASSALAKPAARPRAERAAKRSRPPLAPAAASPASPPARPGRGGSAEDRQAKGEKNERAILDALEASSMTQAALIKASGVPSGSISAVLERMADRGMVEIRKQGHTKTIALPGSSNGASKNEVSDDELKQCILNELKRLPLAAFELGQKLHHPERLPVVLDGLVKADKVQQSRRGSRTVYSVAEDA